MDSWGQKRRQIMPHGAGSVPGKTFRNGAVKNGPDSERPAQPNSGFFAQFNPANFS
jgi:hypothetical protein